MVEQRNLQDFSCTGSIPVSLFPLFSGVGSTRVTEAKWECPFTIESFGSDYTQGVFKVRLPPLLSA